MGETVNGEICIGNINLHTRLVLEGMERGIAWYIGETVNRGTVNLGATVLLCNCSILVFKGVVHDMVFQFSNSDFQEWLK